MSPDAEAALITITGLVIVAVITWVASRQVNSANIARMMTEAAKNLIGPLQKSITALEAKVAALESERTHDKETIIDLQNWLDDLKAYIEHLCCQLRGAGVDPDKFERKYRTSQDDQFRERTNRS